MASGTQQAKMRPHGPFQKPKCGYRYGWHTGNIGKWVGAGRRNWRCIWGFRLGAFHYHDSSVVSAVASWASGVTQR